MSKCCGACGHAAPALHDLIHPSTCSKLPSLVGMVSAAAGAALAPMYYSVAQVPAPGEWHGDLPEWHAHAPVQHCALLPARQGPLTLLGPRVPPACRLPPIVAARGTGDTAILLPSTRTPASPAKQRRLVVSLCLECHVHFGQRLHARGTLLYSSCRMMARIYIAGNIQKGQHCPAAAPKPSLGQLEASPLTFFVSKLLSQIDTVSMGC